MTRGQDNDLGAEIREIIAHDGPISIERYMTLALTHPTKGYYTTRDPFGAQGDFVTAPDMSQMFGELIGLWAAQVWGQIGSPASVQLVELGPGRGVLMADALRAAKAAPEFFDAIEVQLVEASDVSPSSRRERLRACGRPRPGARPSRSFPPARRFSSPTSFSTRSPSATS